MILLAECEKGINNWLEKQFRLRQALHLWLERRNEVAEILDDGGVDLEQTVILLALIKEDVVESDAVEVEVR